MFFKVVVACGHLGFGREVEINRYFQANNAIEAWDSAMHMPRAKKGQGSRCVRKVEQIDYLQYLNGKIAESQDPYLQVRKTKSRTAMAS